MSFYLKYRPDSFDTLVGQRHIVDVLKAQLASQKLNHNYLFYGPRGTWKTSTARLLAKAANDENFLTNPDKDLAERIDSGKILDYVEIDAASHTWVDNIREEIIEKALYTPSVLKKKVYVIDEVHMLSKWAFNALLKIMEEPPAYLMFILATTEIHKVPDTIISRCQVFNFRHHTVPDIVGYLEHIATQEKISYQPDGLQMIAKLAQWGLRDAIKYLEQVSILWEITAENVSTFLGVVSHQTLTWLLDGFKSWDLPSALSLLSEPQQWGTDMMAVCKDLLQYFDEHFQEDPDRYAQMTQVWSDIIRELKVTNMPLVVMKSKLHAMSSTQ